MTPDLRPSVDNNVIKVLPDIREVLSVKFHGESAWAKASRIDIVHEDGSKESYFMKSDPDSHFYICKFYDFTEGLPHPSTFCEKLAQLHSSHTSPEGKFGFHVVTYNGDLPQDTTWSDSWETFFIRGLQHVVNVRQERAGPCPELDGLLPTMLEKVIPRLLRPLETGPNRIKPSLVHGDLWCGNAAITDEDTEEGIIYDPSNELGNWRPVRNKFSRKYFNAYHSHFPKAAPEEDYDDRNALYAMRFNLHAAALFPTQQVYLDMAVEEMRRLIDKFPEGYIGEAADQA
ncbi:Fructosamine kinase-domain-containing protein [Biscogniauxia marginata]|nr:Fructosamine kinase-domain-containing protein [Biscogniauxia marginata]